MRRTAARLGLLVLLSGVPGALGAALGRPGIPSFGPSGLSDSYVPVEAVLQTLGLLAWALWGYLVFTVLLHTAALVASSRELGPHQALIGVSSALTPKVVRYFVELAVSGAVLAGSMTVRVAASDSHQASAIAVVSSPDVSRRDRADEALPVRVHQPTYRVRSGAVADRGTGAGFRPPVAGDLRPEQGQALPRRKHPHEPALDPSGLGTEASAARQGALISRARADRQVSPG
jgi:hypothetical protein